MGIGSGITRETVVKGMAAAAGAAAAGAPAVALAGGPVTGTGGAAGARSELSGVAGLTVYVGVGARGNGLHRLVMDRNTGRLIYRDVAEQQAPGWLSLDSRQRAIYAGIGGNRVAGWRIDPATGRLTFGNAQPTGTAAYPHISVDPTDSVLVGASYGGGSVGVNPILSPGTLGEPTHVVQHAGPAGPVQPDQSQPRAHQIIFDPSRRWAVVQDLGLDRTYVYRVNAVTGALSQNDPPFVQTALGRGPRHGAFHPNGRFLYVINELDSTMTTFAWDSTRGTLREIQNVTALREGWQGARWSAQVVVHPNGRWVYGSNRDDNGQNPQPRRRVGTAWLESDDIVAYGIDQNTGMLTTVGHQYSGGKNPRNFNIDPSGRFMVVAHQDSDNLVVFRIDQATGMILPTGHEIRTIAEPLCVQFAPGVGVS
jgi:6-phosphogluconolactonase